MYLGIKYKMYKGIWIVLVCDMGNGNSGYGAYSPGKESFA